MTTEARRMAARNHAARHNPVPRGMAQVGTARRGTAQRGTALWRVVLGGTLALGLGCYEDRADIEQAELREARMEELGEEREEMRVELEEEMRARAKQADRQSAPAALPLHPPGVLPAQQVAPPEGPGQLAPFRPAPPPPSIERPEETQLDPYRERPGEPAPGLEPGVPGTEVVFPPGPATSIDAGQEEP